MQHKSVVICDTVDSYGLIISREKSSNVREVLCTFGLLIHHIVSENGCFLQCFSTWSLRQQRLSGQVALLQLRCALSTKLQSSRKARFQQFNRLNPCRGPLCGGVNNKDSKVFSACPDITPDHILRFRKNTHTFVLSIIKKG